MPYLIVVNPLTLVSHGWCAPALSWAFASCLSESRADILHILHLNLGEVEGISVNPLTATHLTLN